MAEARSPLTLEQQADLLSYLLRRTTMMDGSTAGETWMLLTPAEVEDLRHLEARLRRMAPHEQAIKRLVVAAR